MFAQKTTVTVEKSTEELRDFLTKIGAVGFSFASYDGEAFLAFTYRDRPVRMKFSIPIHPGQDATIAQVKKFEQARRTKWRQLLLCIKAKFECVFCGVETFDQAFLTHIVLKEGVVVGDNVLNLLTDISEKEIPLHLGFKKSKLRTA